MTKIPYYFRATWNGKSVTMMVQAERKVDARIEAYGLAAVELDPDTQSTMDWERCLSPCQIDGRFVPPVEIVDDPLRLG